MKRFICFFLLSLILVSPGSFSASLWLELRSPHFTMRYQEPERRMAAFLLQRAEETREAVLRDIGHAPPSPILIQNWISQIK